MKDIPSSSLTPENVYTRTIERTAPLEDVHAWASARLHGNKIRDARTAFRALAMVQMGHLSHLDTAVRQNIGMTTLEGEALLDQGYLERALEIESILQGYCDKYHMPYNNRLSRAKFAECGRVALVQKQYQTALRAFTIAGERDGLLQLAHTLHTTMTAMLDEPSTNLNESDTREQWKTMLDVLQQSNEIAHNAALQMVYLYQ